jgi:hypothetical protein
LQADIDQLAGLVGAHRLDHHASVLVDGLLQHGVFVKARLRHNQLAQASAAGFLGRVSEHSRKRGIGVEHVVTVLDGHGLRKAGQDVLHQLRLGGALAAAWMGHNDGLSPLGVEDAVGALHRLKPAVFGGHGGVEGTSLPGSRQQSLRFGGAGKKSPEDVFDWTLLPLAFREAQYLPRFYVGKDDFAGPLQKDQNRQCV